jgi:pantothenate kinase
MAPIGGTILNGIATLRTLTSLDNSLAISHTADHNAFDLKVGNISADHITGVLRRMGLGASEMTAANRGHLLAVVPNHRWTTGDIPRATSSPTMTPLSPSSPSSASMKIFSR